jgi:hypothetical protein
MKPIFDAHIAEIRSKKICPFLNSGPMYESFADEEE